MCYWLTRLQKVIKCMLIAKNLFMHCMEMCTLEPLFSDPLDERPALFYNLLFVRQSSFVL